MNHYYKHPYVTGALLTPNSPYTQEIPCIDPTSLTGAHTDDAYVHPGQTITVVSSRQHESNHLLWWVTSLFSDGVVRTGLMFKDDFIPV
jgi:hypothetical protein